MNIIQKRKKKIGFFVALGALGFLMLFFIKNNRDLTSEESVDSNIQDEVIKNVKVDVLDEEDSGFATLTKTAMFRSLDFASVTAEYTGRITQVNFEVGEFVKKGQILAFFDQSNMTNSPKIYLEDARNSLKVSNKNLKKIKASAEESLELARNARKLAELKLDQAKDDNDSDEIELAKKALENANDVEDQARNEVKIRVNTAQLQVDQLETSVKMAELSYEKTILRAPISGVVVSKDFDLYDYLSMGQVIAKISGENNLKAKLFLSQFEVDKVDVGDEVDIFFGSEKCKGVISALSLIASPDNNRYELSVLSSEESSIYANRNAKVNFRLKLASNEGMFFIPLSALNIGQQKNVVFVEEGGMALEKIVEIGKSVGSDVEIIGGLMNGDRLIVENNRNLRNGQKVNVVE